MEPSLRLRIRFGERGIIGPGKIELLRAIDRTGSISAAARDFSMSYRRAWLLVDAMNTLIGSPVVETTAGGERGGGAHLTEVGRAVVCHYDALMETLRTVAREPLKALTGLMKD